MDTTIKIKQPSGLTLISTWCFSSSSSNSRSLLSNSAFNCFNSFFVISQNCSIRSYSKIAGNQHPTLPEDQLKTRIPPAQVERNSVLHVPQPILQTISWFQLPNPRVIFRRFRTVPMQSRWTRRWRRLAFLNRNSMVSFLLVLKTRKK